MESGLPQQRRRIETGTGNYRLLPARPGSREMRIKKQMHAKNTRAQKKHQVLIHGQASSARRPDLRINLPHCKPQLAPCANYRKRAIKNATEFLMAYLPIYKTPKIFKLSLPSGIRLGVSVSFCTSIFNAKL